MPKCCRLLLVGEVAPLEFTPPYAAPEVVEAFESGSTDIVADAAADIWALGLTAFEVFTGERVFPPVGRLCPGRARTALRSCRSYAASGGTSSSACTATPGSGRQRRRCSWPGATCLTRTRVLTQLVCQHWPGQVLAAALSAGSRT
jgi:hypothetical protein